MIHIDIYLENTEKYVKKKQGWYGYVLTYQGREFHIADGYGWKKSDGTDLKYKELWQEIAKKAEKKEMTFRIRKTHAYTERIRAEIERRKKDDKQGTERISGTIQG